MKFLLTFVLFALGTGLVYGQDNQPIRVTITQLAGQNVYLSAGTEQGIVEGDTLQFLDGSDIRRLLVTTASRKQCVAVFAGAPFALTRGRTLDVIVSKGPRVSGPSEEDTLVESIVKEPEIVSVMESDDARVERRQRNRSSKVKVDGRLLLSFSVLSSETRSRSSSVSPTSRLYLTPAVNLSTTVSNLPSDIRFHLHLRSDYRYQSRNSISPNNSFRAYQIRLEKTLPFGQIQAGRFYNRLTQRGGYWDGVSFLVGSRKKGIGGSVGFMPDRSNEGFTTQFPRYSIFAHYETPRNRNLGYRAAVSFNEIRPSSIFETHTYVGLEQRLDWEFLSIDQDLQLDRDPVSQNWVVSNLQLNTRISLTNRIDLTGRYTQRQPFRFYTIEDPFLTRRDQYSGGFRVRLDHASFGGNYTRRYLNQTYEGRTFTGFFNTRPLTRWGISFSGSGNHWESDIGTALFLNGGIARQFNKIHTRLDYGFYRSTSPNINSQIDMHRFSLSASVPLSRQLYWSIRGSLQQSEFLNSFAANTSLQLRF